MRQKEIIRRCLRERGLQEDHIEDYLKTIKNQKDSILCAIGLRALDGVGLPIAKGIMDSTSQKVRTCSPRNKSCFLIDGHIDSMIACDSGIIRTGGSKAPIRIIEASKNIVVLGNTGIDKLDSCSYIHLRENARITGMTQSSISVSEKSSVGWVQNSWIALSDNSMCDSAAHSYVAVNKGAILKSSRFCRVMIYGGKSVTLNEGSVGIVMRETDTEIILRQGSELRIPKGFPRKRIFNYGGIIIEREDLN